METFQILSDQFSHFQHLFHRWLAIFCIISSYIFDLSSSPPMLGIPLSAPGGDLSKWFIPTYVGHTWADLLKFMSRTVHPHLRGAYSICGRRPAQSAGSSPPTWGILASVPGVPLVLRFIPTYVGHTLDRRKKNGWFQPLFLKFYTKKLFCARSSVFRCYRGRSIPNP